MVSRYHSALVQQLSGGVSAPAASLSDVILELTPEVYWKLDETTGTTVVDSSGNARTGTITSVSANELQLAQVAGPDTNYMKFNGVTTNSKITLASAAWMDTPISFFMLTKYSSVSGELGLFRRVGWYSQRTNNATFTSVATLSASTIRQTLSLSGTGILTTARWNASIFTLSATVPTNIKHTPDADAATGPAAGGSGAIGGGANIFELGINTAGWAFKGGMAHFAAFNRELDSEEIDSLVASADAGGWFN